MVRRSVPTTPNLEIGKFAAVLYPSKGQWIRLLTILCRPTVYAQVRTSLLAENDTESKGGNERRTERAVTSIRLVVASEMVDHIFAGFVALS